MYQQSSWPRPQSYGFKLTVDGVIDNKMEPVIPVRVMNENTKLKE